MCLVPEGGGRNSGPWCLHCIWTVACATWLLLIRTAANAKSAGYGRSPPSFICRVVHLLRCGNGILWKENICTHRLKSTLFPQTLRLLITSPKFQLKNSLKRSESAPVTGIKINYNNYTAIFSLMVLFAYVGHRDITMRDSFISGKLLVVH